MVMSQCSNDNQHLETSQQEFYFYEFSTNFLKNTRNVNLVNYRFKLQLTFSNLTQYWLRTVCFSVEPTFFVLVLVFDRPKLRPARFFGLKLSCFPIYYTTGYFVIFQDFIIILDSPFVTYYEGYNRFFHHFRRFRQFRSFVSFRSFRKRPRSLVRRGKRFGIAGETSDNAPHKHKVGDYVHMVRDQRG